MIFLIEYDRASRTRVRFEQFEDDQRKAAMKRRLRLELEAARTALDHEIVLLEAESEKDIRQTHSRYFVDVQTLRNRLATGLDRAASK